MLASRGHLPGRYLRAGHVQTVLARLELDSTIDSGIGHRTTEVGCGV